MKKINSEIASKLKDGYESGLSIKELSNAFDLSAYYIKIILLAQDIKIKHGNQGASQRIPSEETILKNIARENKKLEIIHMYKSGKTFEEIAEHFGCTRQNIFVMLKKRDLK